MSRALNGDQPYGLVIARKAHHIPVPLEGHGIREAAPGLGPSAVRVSREGWRAIGHAPNLAILVPVLDPGMGFILRHEPVAALRHPGAQTVAIHHTGGDAPGAEHEREGGCEILAVARLGPVKEILQRIRGGPAGIIEGVAEGPEARHQSRRQGRSLHHARRPGQARAARGFVLGLKLQEHRQVLPRRWPGIVQGNGVGFESLPVEPLRLGIRLHHLQRDATGDGEG